MRPISRRALLAALPAACGLAKALTRSPGASEADEAQKYWFTDVSNKSSISYRSNNNFTGRKYFPQPMCGGVAAIDYNNDGWMDLFFTNGAKLPELKKTGPEYYNCLLRNNRDGTFTDVTEKAGLLGADLGFCFGAAVADYDNDGHSDIFVCNAGRNALYQNNGNGTFTDVTAGSGLDRKPENLLSVGAAWFDYDNDGRLDLIVTNYTVWTPQSDQKCLRDPEHEEYCTPTVYKSVASRLYRNLGNGKFQDVTEASGIGKALGKGMGISIADFDRDGWMDIFVANDTEPNFLFMNQKDGTFKEHGLEFGVAYNMQGDSVSGMGSDAKDFDNDGWVDVVYNDLSGQVFGLLKNDGGKSFTDVTWSSKLGALSRRLSGWSVGFVDFDNDGWKDLYSANGDVDNLTVNAKQHDTMFRNVDGKTLVDVSAEMGPDFGHVGYQRGSAFVDLNNDGFMDLVVTSLNEKPRILMNNAVTKNHWLMLDLEGTKSNRDGTGAVIEVETASGRKLHNHVTTSVGFMSSSDQRVHFGLGAESKINHVEIRWPSGILQRIEKPGVDQILKVKEAEQKAAPKTR
ncbi:MAG TPA: CRTAC1 family protein [Terracidiphilus sp.]|nr:CRTAC1 family protein [Terracidiphilus sp.]